jgi:plastocyanin
VTKRVLAVVALLAVMALPACGGDDEPGALPPQPPADRRGQSAVSIDAVDNEFQPEVVLVDAGTTVTWTNKGTGAHNVKKALEPVDFGGQFGVEIGAFQPGDSYDFTFDKVGNYHYVCTIHTGMDGEVRVEAPNASTTSTTSAG